MGHGFSAGRSTDLSSFPFFLTHRNLPEFTTPLCMIRSAWGIVLLGSSRFTSRLAEFPFYILQLIIRCLLLQHRRIAFFLDRLKLLAQLPHILFQRLLPLVGVCQLSLKTAKLLLQRLHFFVGFPVFLFGFFKRFDKLVVAILYEGVVSVEKTDQ